MAAGYTGAALTLGLTLLGGCLEGDSKIQDFGKSCAHSGVHIFPNETATMLEESTNNADNIEIENISVTTDLLRRMLVELQGLEVNNARLHFAMSNTVHVIRQRLDMLSGITELLKADQAPSSARELTQRAKALILQLAGKLEQLALEAEHEFEWIT
jgi:hypothetical protein